MKRKRSEDLNEMRFKRKKIIDRNPAQQWDDIPYIPIRKTNLIRTKSERIIDFNGNNNPTNDDDPLSIFSASSISSESDDRTDTTISYDANDE